MNPNKILLYSLVSALFSHHDGIFLLQHMGKNTMTKSQTIYLHTTHTHAHTHGWGHGDRHTGTHNSKYNVSIICLTSGFREFMEKEAEKV